MATRVVDSLNLMTATALDDFKKQEPEVLNDPDRVRPTIRLLVVLAAVTGFVAATVTIYRIQAVYRVGTVISTGHNVNNALAFGTRMLFETNISLSTRPTDSLQVVCPCEGSSLIGITTKQEWQVFVNFSLISLVNGTQDQFTQTNFSTFCNDVTVCNSSCYDILRAAIPDCDWSSKSYRLNHNILSPNLLSLDSLRDAIYTQIFLNEKFVSVEADNQFFRYALEAMLGQTKQNSSSSDFDFWTAAESTRTDYGYNYALAMHIDWVAYSKLCNPQVCTAVMYVPPWRRTLNAVGLMGGYLSIIRLALGTVLWPALVWLCGFPKWSPGGASSNIVQPYDPRPHGLETSF